MTPRRLILAGLLCLALRCAGTAAAAELNPWHAAVLGALLLVAALGAVALLFRNESFWRCQGRQQNGRINR